MMELMRPQGPNKSCGGEVTSDFLSAVRFCSHNSPHFILLTLIDQAIVVYKLV